MHPQAVNVALFAGHANAIGFALVEMTSEDADVIADRNGQTVDQIDLIGVGLLGDFGQERKQGLPEGVGEGMQASIEPALAEHVGKVAMLLKEEAAPLLVAHKESRGNQDDGHDLGVGHLGLWIVSIAVGG